MEDDPPELVAAAQKLAELQMDKNPGETEQESEGRLLTLQTLILKQIYVMWPQKPCTRLTRSLCDRVESCAHGR